MGNLGLPGKAYSAADFPALSDPALLAKFAEESAIDHPDYYGGGDNPYEAIKVMEAWEHLGLHVVQAIKYLARYDKKENPLRDLKKARWYIDRKISLLEGQKNG